MLLQRPLSLLLPAVVALLAVGSNGQLRGITNPQEQTDQLWYNPPLDPRLQQVRKIRKDYPPQ